MLQSRRSCAHTYDFNLPSPELKIRIFPAQPAAGVTHELYTVHIDSSISLNFPYINMLLQIYYITDSPLYQYSLPTISTTTLFVKPTGLSILKHSISFRWPIQIAYSSYLYGLLFICDCLPSLFLSFLLFYRYFVNPARKASLTDSVRFFPSSSAILRSALSISRSR